MSEEKEVTTTKTQRATKSSQEQVNPEVKQEQESVNPEVQEQEPLANKRIYVGPGKPGLITNTVYDGDYPFPVQEMIKQCPSIEKLIVKISELAEKSAKVREKGTMEHRHAVKVLEYFKGEGEPNDI